MRRRGRALVFGDDTRSFLAIVRSLGRGGIEVHAAPGDFRSASLRSKFITDVHSLPAYVGDGAEWCRQVERLLRGEAFDLVIPCDERTLLPLDRHRDIFEGLSRLALPSHDALAVLFDKQKTREVAISVGVPVAEGRVVRPDDSAGTLVAEFGLPVVVKPCRSYTLETLYARGRAETYDSEASLARAFPLFGKTTHLVERYRPGGGVGVSILASSGRMLQAFQHVRARERAGAGFYRASAPLSPTLLASVEAVVRGIRFTGVAMFEFKVDAASQSWVLLEVNARPWGSMPLPLSLGIDFPLRWYRLLVEGEETPPQPYKFGVYQRNLLQDTHQILALARDMRRRPATAAAYLLKTTGELKRFVAGREHFDALVADDPAPGLFELYRGATGVAVRLLRGVPVTRAVLRQRDRSIVRRVVRRSRGRPVVVAFVCSGNVCRSPFAAELLRRSLFERSPDVRVVAAGILPRDGSSSPRAAIEAARKHGVDLSKHRSAYLTEQDAHDATIAVIFDEQNRGYLAARYPNLLRRTVLLGSFLGGRCGPLEIGDPDGGDVGTFERTYKDVSTAIPRLAAAIAQARAA